MRSLVRTHTLGHGTNTSASFSHWQNRKRTPVKITSSAFLDIPSRVMQDLRTLNAHV